MEFYYRYAYVIALFKLFSLKLAIFCRIAKLILGPLVIGVCEPSSFEVFWEMAPNEGIIKRVCSLFWLLV